MILLAGLLAWRWSVQRVPAEPDPARLPVRTEEGMAAARDLGVAVDALDTASYSWQWMNWHDMYCDSASIPEEAREALVRSESVSQMVTHSLRGRKLCMTDEWTIKAPRLFSVLPFAHRQVYAAALERDRGENDSAAERLLQSLAVMRELRRCGPGVIGFLIGISGDNILLQELTRDVPGWCRTLPPATIDRIIESLVERSASGFGVEDAFRNEYFYASRSLERSPDEEMPLSDLMAYRFLFERQPTLDYIGDIYQEMTERGRLTTPELRAWAQSRDTSEPLRPFLPFNIYGWLLASGNRLPGVLMAGNQGIARSRVALLAFWLGSNRDLTKLDQSFLTNPTTGSRWNIEKDQRKIVDRIDCPSAADSGAVLVNY